MWHVAQESKIQLLNYKMSSKFPLEHFSLSDIHAIDAYIFWSLLFLPLFQEKLTFSLKRTWFRHFSLSFWWLWTFCNNVIFRSASKTFARRMFHLSVVRITSRMRFYFSFWFFWIFLCRVISTSTKSALCLDKICSLTIYTTTWASIKI